MNGQIIQRRIGTKGMEMETFKRQVAAHEELIYGICSTLLSGEEAEQAACHAIRTMYSQWNKAAGRGNLEHWIRFVTVWTCRQWMKRNIDGPGQFSA